MIPQSVQAVVYESGITIEQVPKALFGTWRVNAKLDNTNSSFTFKPQSIDFWELSRIGDRITLNNPFSGARAEIQVVTVENNLIVFSKKLSYDGNKTLTDTVTIRLDENKFSGINSLRLETFSLIDNQLIKTEIATYNLNGEKLSGESVLE